MKKILILLTIGLILTSCKKDELTETQITKKDLLGTWNVSKISSENGSISGTMAGFPVSSKVNITGSDYKMKVTFNKEQISSEGSFKITPEFEKPPFNIYNTPHTIKQFPVLNVNWDVKNKKIVTGESETGIKVVEFSSNKIVLSNEISKMIPEDVTNLLKMSKEIKFEGELLIELTK